MQLINEVKDILDLQNEDQETTYDLFQEFMTNLFEKVMDDDWMKKNDKEIFTGPNLKMLHVQSNMNMREKTQQQDPSEDLYDFK